MSKTVLITLASLFVAASASAAGLGHGPSMARDGAMLRHDASTGMHKSKRADNIGVDNRQGNGKDDFILKRNGADNPPGDNRRGKGTDDTINKRKGADDPANDVRRGRRQDDPAGDDRRGRGADDGPGHG